MSAPDLFSVPRRFDLITVLVATTGYALLFTALKLFNLSSEWLGIVGALFAIVAIGQALTEGKMSPRVASTYAAVVFWGLFLLYGLLRWGYEGTSDSITGAIVICAILSVFYGVLTGYFVGTLVAGVFLVSYHLREKLAFAARAPVEKAETPQDFSPWDEST